MKELFESKETFEAYAIIDGCYYLIEQEYKQLSKPVSPIIKAIDRATGYESELTKEAKTRLITCLTTIIQYKKKIDADYSKDENFLTEIKNLNH